LRETLVEAARAAARTRNTYLSAQYHRIAHRRGGKKATIAVAHSILVIAYHLIAGKKTHEDLGANYFDEVNRERVSKRLVKRLQSLGYSVTMEPPSKPSSAA